MVEAPVPGTNQTSTRLTYSDSIEFFQKCHWKKAANYSDLYLKEGLSAAQIGERFGVPKQTILKQLRHSGIKLGGNKGRMDRPDNYRLAYAPYGFSKKENLLVPNKSELKVCRLVVQLRNLSAMSFQAIAAELVRRELKNRDGRASWRHSSVGRIYKRWNGKV